MLKKLEITFYWNVQKNGNFPSGKIMERDRNCEISIRRTDNLEERITITTMIEEELLIEEAFLLGGFVRGLEK
jgi:hypothetical protein